MKLGRIALHAALITAAAAAIFMYMNRWHMAPITDQAMVPTVEETVPTTIELTTPAENNALIPENSTQSLPTEPVTAMPEVIQQPAVTAQEQTVSQPTAHTITVHNNITRAMITYRKALGSYTPEFHLYVNDTPVQPGSAVTVTADDHAIAVKYTYNFLKGYKVGSKTTRVTLAPDVTDTSITFSWKDTNHIIVSGAHTYTITQEN